MNFSKKQMIIGAVVLVAGVLVYKKYYAKPVTEGTTPSTPPVNTTPPASSQEVEAAVEAAAAAESVASESFMGKGKRKKGDLSSRTERIAKEYSRLLKKGLDPIGVQEALIKRIKGNKSSKEEQVKSIAVLNQVAMMKPETLNQIAEIQKVGGGDGFTPQAFVM